MDYDFGQKRHWRRWVWNQIARRLQDRREGLVVYLPGPEDYDRPLALARGFPRRNLLGVERDVRVAARLRSKGVTVVEGDFYSSVDAVSLEHPVSVVFGDFCNGFNSRSLARITDWMLNTGTHRTVFAFNLLRGHDKDGPIGLDGWNLVVNGILNGDVPDAPTRNETNKHRALLLFAHVIYRLAKVIEDSHADGEADSLHLRARFRELSDKAGAQAHSYRSTSRQTMDSVVFTNPMAFYPDLGLNVTFRDVPREEVHKAKESCRAALISRLGH